MAFRQGATTLKAYGAKALNANGENGSYALGLIPEIRLRVANSRRFLRPLQNIQFIYGAGHGASSEPFDDL